MNQPNETQDKTFEPIDWRGGGSDYDPLIGRMDLYDNPSSTTGSALHSYTEISSGHQTTKTGPSDLFEQAIDRVLVPESFPSNTSHMRSTPQIWSYPNFPQGFLSYSQNGNPMPAKDMRTDKAIAASSDPSLFQQSTHIISQLDVSSPPTKAPGKSFSGKSFSGKKQHGKNDGFLPKPKRCLSAYNLFFQEERKLLLKSHPDGSDLSGKEHSGKKIVKLGFANMARAIAARWKTIDPDLKQAYEILAARDGERYDREMAKTLIDLKK